MSSYRSILAIGKINDSRTMTRMEMSFHSVLLCSVMRICIYLWNERNFSRVYKRKASHKVWYRSATETAVLLSTNNRNLLYRGRQRRVASDASNRHRVILISFSIQRRSMEAGALSSDGATVLARYRMHNNAAYPTRWARASRCVTSPSV